MSIEPASTVSISGVRIRTSDIRALVDENDARTVLLQNGMRLTISEDEREKLMKVLRGVAGKIISQAREKGSL